MAFQHTKRPAVAEPPPVVGDVSADAEALFKEARQRERRRRLIRLGVVVTICVVALEIVGEFVRERHAARDEVLCVVDSGDLFRGDLDVLEVVCRGWSSGDGLVRAYRDDEGHLVVVRRVARADAP